MGHWELIPFVLSAVLTALCAAIVWTRRTRPGARSFAAILLAETLWSLGYVGELSSATLSGKLFWDDVQYLAVLGLLPGMLVFAWDYSERPPRRARLWLALSMLLPVATFAWVVSDGWHHHARASAHVVPAPPFDALLYDFTPIEWLLFVQAYATVLWLGWVAGRASRTHHKHHRLQSVVIVVGLMFPMLSTLLGIFGLRFLLGQRDTAPASFGIASLGITWAMLRGRFFDATPVARHVVFAQLPDPVLVLDAGDRLLDLNPCAQALLGEHAQVGQPLTAALAAEPARALLALVPGARIEVELDTQTFEARCEPLSSVPERGRVVLLRDISRRKDAERALTSAHEALEARVAERTRALHLANQAMASEIAERKRLELAARQSEARFEALFDNAVELMGMLSPEGILLAANRTALELAGVAAEAVVGRPFWEGPWWRHSAELQAQLRAAVAEAARGALVTMEVTHPGASGALHHVTFSLKPLGSSEHGLVLIAEGRDITELKRAEEERAALKEALHQSQRLEAVGRLAGGIAHDFNNLLTVILGQIELGEALLERGGDPRPSLQQASDAGMSAAGLTRQLLAFARKQPTVPRVLALNQAVEQTHGMLKRLIGEDIELCLSLAPSLRRVRIDPTQLEQLLLNLAVNARDAMPSGGRLHITTDDVELAASLLAAHGLGDNPAHFVRLRVADTGAGMSPEVLTKVFEPFFTTKAPGKGTGIGLATVHSIVQQAGGFVEAHSQPGQGASFDVFLPATESPPEPRSAAALDVPRGSERVALVEDQAGLRELVSEQLHRLGYQVTAFSKAEDALRALSSPAPDVDLLVTDVVLAGMSGPSLAEQLRRDRPLKVLFVSGYTNGAILARGVDENAVRLLHKPFTLRELAQAVRGAIEDAP